MSGSDDIHSRHCIYVLVDCMVAAISEYCCSDLG